MTQPEETIFWLVPCTADAARFQAIIDALAADQVAPSFKPHLTLGAVRGSAPRVERVVKALAGVTLAPKEIDQTDLFTMSLFVRLHSSPALSAGRNALESVPGFRFGRAFDPHLSLCYGPPVHRTSTTAEIKSLLDKPVRFDRLVAMHIPLPVETHDDVRKWREVASHSIDQQT